jgi:hypothetical protein
MPNSVMKYLITLDFAFCVVFKVAISLETSLDDLAEFLGESCVVE